MTKKSTLMWRTGVLGMLVAAVPLGIYSYEKRNEVDSQRMLDVSVSIKTISHVTIDKYGDSVWETGSGSGFLVSSEDCEVWTNHHVIEDAATIEVFPNESSQSGGIPATVVNSTPRTDIAILRMRSCDNMPEAVLGDSDAVRPGDETYAVGNPLGRNPDSISRGIISHTERYASGATPFLQTDAAINLGSSGGALFNRYGQVIGINSAIAATPKGANVGIGYAIPINTAKLVAAQLHNGPPSWGDAGITDVISSLSPDEAAVFGVPTANSAVILTSEPDEGPSIGKLQAHDAIFQINDTPVVDAAQALRVISSHDAGKSIDFHLVRAGEVCTVAVDLAEGWKAEEERSPEFYDGYLGMTIEMWSEEDGERAQFKAPVITRVQSLGPAHKARITSSQRAMAYRGPFRVPVILEVKTVTGIVLSGEYHPVDRLDELDRFAAMAYESQVPLLLEIELWRRPDPMDFELAFEQVGKAFFKVTPEITTGHAPDPEDEDSMVETSSRSTDRLPYRQDVHPTRSRKAS